MTRPFVNAVSLFVHKEGDWSIE